MTSIFYIIAIVSGIILLVGILAIWVWYLRLIDNKRTLQKRIDSHIKHIRMNPSIITEIYDSMKLIIMLYRPKGTKA